MTYVPPPFLPLPEGTKPLLDPRNDLVFKMIFADAPDLLTHLINAVRHDSPPVQVERILNPSITPEDVTRKFIALDILAVDDSGHRFNIEMQMRSHPFWPARSVYYLAQSYARQLPRGGDYSELRPAIGINLLNFELFGSPPDRSKALWRFGLVDLFDRRQHLDDTLELNMIELPKADRLGLFDSPRLQALRDWVTLLQHCGDPQRMGEIIELPVRDALGRVINISQDEYHRQLADSREKALRDERSFLRFAREEGLAEGRALGRAEGKSELLVAMIESRFGRLSECQLAILRGATSAELDQYAKNLLTAESVTDLL